MRAPGVEAALEELSGAGTTTIGLLSATEVAAARRIALGLDIPDDAPFWTTNVHAPRRDAAAASDALLEIGRAAVERALPGLTAIWAAVIAKGACGDNWIIPHQDWDYTDERLHRSYVAWCPLADAAFEDGVLHVVHGSHRWLDNRRGTGAFPEPFAPHLDLLMRSGTGGGVEAGTAVVYDTAALHYSPPNDGERNRLVAGFVLVPAGATPVHLRASDDGTTAGIFRVDPRFFTVEPFRACPPGTPVASVPIGPSTVSDDEIHRLLAGR